MNALLSFRNLRRWFAHLVQIWALCMVADCFPPAAIAYDGRNQTSIAYDGAYLLVFNYDFVPVLTSVSEAMPIAGANNLFGKFAEFLPTEGAAEAKRLVRRDSPGQYDQNSLGAIMAAEGMGIDRNNNVLRDSMGEGLATLGELGLQAAINEAGGAVGRGLGRLAGKVLCEAKPLASGLARALGAAGNALTDGGQTAAQLSFPFANDATGSEVTYLYQKLSAAGEHLKFGITANPATRYTAAELSGGSLRIIAQGERSEMLALERQLHVTLPIGPEEGQAFYIQKQVQTGLKPPPY